MSIFISSKTKGGGRLHPKPQTLHESMVQDDIRGQAWRRSEEKKKSISPKIPRLGFIFFLF